MVKKALQSAAVSLATLLAAPLQASELPTELARCAGIDKDAERLRCYDRLAAKPPVRQAESSSEPVEQRANSVDQAPASGVTDASGAESTTPDTKPALAGRWLGIRPYRRNYILPISYNSRPNPEPFADVSDRLQLEDVEIKFQFSLEIPLWERIFDYDFDLYFAYTQLSFFQAYNTEYSSPFRDTAYEPELGIHWQPNLKFGGWTLTSARLALNHQSNGRTQVLSRSWNRLIGQVRAEHGNLIAALRIWKRVNEDSENDDNPDITEFMGHGEFYAGYDLGRQRFGVMLRNPIKHAGVQLDWSYLLSGPVRLYIQYFNGYGESLIDYDHDVSRISAGFLLNEWP